MVGTHGDAFEPQMMGLALRHALRKAKPPKDKSKRFVDRNRYHGPFLRILRAKGGGAKEQARAARRVGLGVALMATTHPPKPGSELTWSGGKWQILRARYLGRGRYQVIFSSLPTGGAHG